MNIVFEISISVKKEWERGRESVWEKWSGGVLGERKSDGG